MTPRQELRAVRNWRLRQGYTLVELMMAIAVFAIGVSGIIAMQKVAAAANQHSKALSVATNIAQTWTDQLNADASLYIGTNGLVNTQWLKLAPNTGTSGWLRPDWNAARHIGAAFDALGNPIDEANGGDVTTAQFCVHVRLTQLYGNSVGINVIRTEVRAFWPRNDANLAKSFCTTGMTPAEVLTATSSFHFIYQVSAVRQQQ